MLAKFTTMKMPGIDYLHSLVPLGMTGDLRNMERLLAAFHYPEKEFDSIHVVGTDGKGSTAFYLSVILSAHHLRSGLYTSPHLVNVRERIRINDVPIAEPDFDRLLLKVKNAAEANSVRLSFFEAVTLVCFLYFEEQNVDVAVVEAGLGGRLDSTRTANGKWAILTSIGLEHTELLGNTESEILHEKLGILADGATIFVGGICSELIRDAENFVKPIHAKVIVPKIREEIQVPNPGHHYIENASLSLAAAAVYLGDLYDDSIALKALMLRPWAGRMQKLIDRNGNFRWLLDGAHNPHAAKRLAEALWTYFPGKKFPCVFGSLKDKNLDEMLTLLSPFVSEWFITRTPYPRFREVENIASELRARKAKVVLTGELNREFLDSVQSLAKGSPVLLTGSLYMIGKSIDLLKNDFEDLRFFRGLEMSESESH